jgi:two-component system CheB/CheR fusion protein
MITFEEIEPPKAPPAVKAKGRGTAREPRRVAQLEQELRATQETLQTTVEELETSNEELRSTNEELQSTNEELQSTNEELETSKEELQSVNEELVTVNTELQGKIEELSTANHDMKHLMESLKLATIFLDNDLHVKRFTLQAKAVFNLIQSDVGRPLADLVSNLHDTDLVEACRQVHESLLPVEKEVETKQNQWYLMRIIPHRTSENVIDGVVVTFTDITNNKQEGGRLRDTEQLYRLFFEQNPQPMWIVDRETLAFLAANEAALQLYGYSREETLALTLKQLLVAKEDASLMQHSGRFAQKSSSDGPSATVWEYIKKDGTVLKIEVLSKPIVHAGKEAILSICRDQTSHAETAQEVAKKGKKAR